MTPRTLRAFLALTFGLSWGTGVLLVLFADQVEAIFGPMGYTNPIFILVVYAPGFAGILLVWRHYGVKGLGSFLRRLTLWRMPLIWWVVLIVGMPAVFYLGAAINGTLDDGFPFTPWYGVLPALGIALVIGPIEEFGWRGVALPLLQRRFAPLSAALILGAIVALWHVPAFLLSGTKQSSWSIGPFLLGVVAISVILTPMFNAARGSLLIAALFHFQMNGPAWPDAQPWDMLLFAVVAAVVVLVNKKSMLSRAGAVTEILMPGEERPASISSGRGRP
jgi:membrane protease YdiL (CAAX protease family)